MTTRMAEPNEGADYLMELNAEQRSAATAIGNGGLGRKMRFDDLPNVRQWQSNRITVTLREKEVLQMDRGADSAIAKAGLGLTMLEAKATLAAVQQEVVAAQAKQIVMQSQVCPDCGAVRKEKDSRHGVYRTLFCQLRLRSPRLLTCPCQGTHSRQSFSPLADRLTARSPPEWVYLRTRWASIVSYAAGRRCLMTSCRLAPP